jgi:ribosome recycling factor
VWDKSLVKPIEKAIRDANLGLNPVADGTTIRVPIPPLNEERRQELTKIAAKYSEDARIAVRNVRRDGMDSLKKMEKSNEISEDEHKKLSTEIQKLTDDHISKIDASLAAKQKEIMQV